MHAQQSTKVTFERLVPHSDLAQAIAMIGERRLAKIGTKVDPADRARGVIIRSAAVETWPYSLRGKFRLIMKVSLTCNIAASLKVIFAFRIHASWFRNHTTLS